MSIRKPSDMTDAEFQILDDFRSTRNVVFHSVIDIRFFEKENGKREAMMDQAKEAARVAGRIFVRYFTKHPKLPKRHNETKTSDA